MDREDHSAVSIEQKKDYFTLKFWTELFLLQYKKAKVIPGNERLRNCRENKILC